jgi:hypothetical protein
VIFAFVPDAYFGKTFINHLTEMKGRGRYQAVEPRDGKPLQFVYIDEQGNDTGKFVGVGFGRKKISFGDKDDNRQDD